MFTAIALVAFSSVSMANTIEIEEVREINCVDVAIAALEAADPNNTMTNVQAHNFFQAQYNACERSKKTISAN
jgi:hypothetical protein